MRKGFTIIIILLSCFRIQAQENFQPETTIGIRQGINVSRVNFNPAISQNITTGYLGGLVFKHISQESLGIQIELNFSQQGWTETMDSTYSYFRRLNYINLPLMTHIVLGTTKTNFFINLGPSLTYLISEKENLKLDITKDEQIYYRKKIDNRLEYGLCVGLGLVKTTSIGSFQIECRLNQSLTDIFKQASEPSILSSKMQTVELSISYLIDFRKGTQFIYKRLSPNQS